MTTTTEHKIDRTKFGPGPWDSEPDRLDFVSSGMPCLIHRNQMGALCGYVAVPPGHALHGEDYDVPDVRVHGGLTYSGACRGHICHVPAPGEPEDERWIEDLAALEQEARDEPQWRQTRPEAMG